MHATSIWAHNEDDAFLITGTDWLGSANGIAVSSVAMAVLFFITGTLLIFYGRYFFKPVLFLAGFYVGAMVTLLILLRLEPMDSDGQSKWGDRRQWIFMGACLGAGCLVGLLMMWIWRLGLFAIGAMGGFVVSLFLLGWVSGSMFTSDLGRTCFILAFCVAGGILALVLEHHVVIVATAVMGSYLLVLGVDMFVHAGLMNLVSAVFRGHAEGYQIQNQVVYGLLVSWIVVAIIGCVVQYRLTARDHSQYRKELA